MPSQITCASTLPGKTRTETPKLHFFTHCISALLPGFNQSLLDLFSVFDSRLILTLLYDSLNLVMSGALGGMVQEKEVESAATVGLSVTLWHA